MSECARSSGHTMSRKNLTLNSCIRSDTTSVYAVCLSWDFCLAASALLGHMAIHSIRCGLLLWTVCVCACGTHWWALQKQPNRLGVPFWVGPWSPRNHYYMGAQSPPGKGTVWGNVAWCYLLYLAVMVILSLWYWVTKTTEVVMHHFTYIVLCRKYGGCQNLFFLLSSSLIF